MNEPTRTTGPRILVVEDHGSLRSSVVTWLQCMFPGCVVQGAESGEDAIVRAQATCPDVVLMDINLPGIDGIEATRQIKAHAPGAAVVMLTTHDTPYHRLAAANVGASGYVVKRDMEEQLEAAVRGLLRSRTVS